MDPKTLFLLGFVIFRIDHAFRSQKLAFLAENEMRKSKPSHNTSLLLSLQSTDPVMTSQCLKGWCGKLDKVFVIPYQYINWHSFSHPFLISHFSKMLYHSRRLPHDFEWYMFAFDDNFFFVQKLMNELEKMDSTLPIYTILRDPIAKIDHKPVLIFSRYALNIFYDQEKQNCDENLHNFDEWLTSCMLIPPISMSMDKDNKSRIFAMHRHFVPDEMYTMKTGYNDDKEYIYSHSSSLLSFTALSEIDLKLLPIFAEKVIKG